MPSTPAHAAYLRHPDVRGDLVAFTAANDIWLAPLSGGRAWRLTDEGAPGRLPALLARRRPRRLHLPHHRRARGVGRSPPRAIPPRAGSPSWGEPSTKVVGWLPRRPHRRRHQLRRPDRTGCANCGRSISTGTAEVLPLGRSGEVAIHPSGTTVVSTPWRRDQASWKHYQGGTAVKLWLSRQDVALDAPADAHAERSWEPLLDDILASTLRISWYGDRLIFASDTPGPGAALNDRATANLWSVAMDGTDLQVPHLVDLREGYLREPSTDGSTIVFSSRGRLFAMDSLEAPPREIEILASGVGAARLPRPASPTRERAGHASARTTPARASSNGGAASTPSPTAAARPACSAGTCGLRLREVRSAGPLPLRPVRLRRRGARGPRERRRRLRRAGARPAGRRRRGDPASTSARRGPDPARDPLPRRLQDRDLHPRQRGAPGDPARPRPTRPAPRTPRRTTPVPAPEPEPMPRRRRASTMCARWAAPTAARCRTSPGRRTAAGWCGAEPNSWMLSRLMISDTEDRRTDRSGPAPRASTRTPPRPSAPTASTWRCSRCAPSRPCTTTWSSTSGSSTPSVPSSSRSSAPPRIRSAPTLTAGAAAPRAGGEGPSRARRARRVVQARRARPRAPTTQGRA